MHLNEILNWILLRPEREKERERGRGNTKLEGVSDVYVSNTRQTNGGELSAN